MPIQYAGIRQEHIAVRTDVGVFDVSHMGQVETRGPDALAFLQRMVTNDVRRIPEGGAQYSLMCRDDGGVLDDLFSYRLADCHYLTVTNAANHERDLAWLAQQATEFDVDVFDRCDDYAMLAVQGPRARALVQKAQRRDAAGADALLPADDRGYADARVCGTGYTGEDGVELLLDPGISAGRVGRDRRRGRGPGGARRARHAAPGGLFSPVRKRSQRGPRPDRSRPGLVLQGGHRVHRLRGGRGGARREGSAEKLVPFAVEGPGIARQGNAVVGGGVVTSGSFSPCLERGIGMAYVVSDRAEIGTRIEIDVRGTIRSAVIEPKPLYRKGS